VKLSSTGPIFFGQERIGLDGRRFKMWKFRSMKVDGHVNAENIPGWTVKDDPRKTKFGSFLRASSLDELPQLWNVFVGDMSLVGPRPEQPYYVEKFRHEIPAYMLRHKMKAGITGWAQVNGWRGDTSLHERIECDLYYIRNWSLWFDVKILFLTFWKGFINKNAY
jgi:lipopolysaccharide/colanic/teichoic acid biosynthesis glycosyltransferase